MYVSNGGTVVLGLAIEAWNSIQWNWELIWLDYISKYEKILLLFSVTLKIS